MKKKFDWEEFMLRVIEEYLVYLPIFFCILSVPILKSKLGLGVVFLISILLARFYYVLMSICRKLNDLMDEMKKIKENHIYNKKH
jgi:hypothetical protein